MQRAEFGQLDAVLASLAPAALTTNLLLGVLTATLPARCSLPARRALLPVIEQVLRGRGDYEEALGPVGPAECSPSRVREAGVSVTGPG